MSEKKLTFTRFDTNMVKGIAILAMVIHHVLKIKGNIHICYQDGNYVDLLLGSSGKVCVALLTILSGYGLFKSAESIQKGLKGGIRFSLSHYVQLMSIYWPCLLFVIIALSLELRTLYFKNIYFADYFGLANLFGHGSRIGTWYLTAIVIMYFLFPAIKYMIDRFGWAFLAVLYLPLAYDFLAVYGVCKWVPNTNTFIFHLFSFGLGMYCAKIGLFDKLKTIMHTRNTFCFSIFVCVALIFARAYVTEPLDPFLAMAFICLSIFVISETKYLCGTLSFFGKHSANIWLLHLYINDVLFFRLDISGWVAVLICFALSLTLSVAFEYAKQIVGYQTVVKYLRDRLK